jgi:hypothetical protein
MYAITRKNTYDPAGMRQPHPSMMHRLTAWGMRSGSY